MQHVSDDTLERYAMQTLPEAEAAPLELHLLVLVTAGIGWKSRLNT